MYASRCFYFAAASLVVFAAYPAFSARAADDPATAGTSLEEITVTAQRREENAKDVPITVVTVTPEMMTALNVDNIQDLQFVTPGLVFNQGINYSIVSIRGIGSYTTNAGLEPSVATYIDGAYLERGFGALYDMVDPASVQILKGPQGTLWGRNATGGALVLTSVDPQQTFSATANAEVGNLGHEKTDLMLNLPISETLATRFAFRYRDDGGYVNDLTTGQQLGWAKETVARGKLAFRPNEDFSAVFEYEYDNDLRSLDPNSEGLPAPLCAYCVGSAYRYPLPNYYTTVINNVNGGLGAQDNTSFYDLRLTYELPMVTVSSVSAYRKTRNFAAGDFDFTEINGFNLFQYSAANTLTQNLTATTKLPGIVNAIAGVDYLHDTPPAGQFYVSDTDYHTGPSVNSGKINTKSIAGFAEVEVKPIPDLTLTGGGRYTADSRQPFANPANGDSQASGSWSAFTPRGVIAYDMGPTNVYFSYNKGFKAGGYSGTAEFQPEKIASYELGTKYADDKIRANLAAFYYKYKDIQVTGVNQSNVGNIATANNAGAATGKGIDFDAVYQLNSTFRLNGAVSWLNAQYDTYKGAEVQVPVYNAAGQVTGTGVGYEDLSGFPLPRAPRWNGDLGGTLKTPMPDAWTAEFTTLAHFTSWYYMTDGGGGPLRYDRQSAYTTANASARIFPAGDTYEVSFFVLNFTNSGYANYRFTTAPFGAYEDVARPRTYGVGITAKF